MIEIDGKRKTDELDLRSGLVTFLRNWKLWLVMAVIFGLAAAAFVFFSPQSYKAESIVSLGVSNNSLLLASPENIVNSDAVKEIAAEKLNMDVEDLPIAELKVDNTKTDRTIVTITVESNTDKEALAVADAWAMASVEWFQASIDSYNEELVEASTLSLEAYNDFLNYLEANNLEALTWTDLVVVVGLYDSYYSVLEDSTNDLPTITLKQRSDLAELMQNVMIRQTYLQRLVEDYSNTTTGSDFKALVLNKAVLEEQSILADLIIIVLGAFMGFILAVIWIYLKDWWKRTAPVES